MVGAAHAGIEVPANVSGIGESLVAAVMVSRWSTMEATSQTTVVTHRRGVVLRHSAYAMNAAGAAMMMSPMAGPSQAVGPPSASASPMTGIAMKRGICSTAHTLSATTPVRTQAGPACPGRTVPT
jgi:hypothetical protein